MSILPRECNAEFGVFRETLINCLGERITALYGARNLDYPFDTSRFLRFVRLALHLAQTINQHFLRGLL